MGLFYNYAKYNTRLVSKAFFTKVRISGEQHIPQNKPVLLALNHPNSFLDAVVVGGHLTRETHFLARGDAFHNKFAKPILHSLNMLPIFRLSEGKENLERNNETFDACQAILDQNKMVILFAEGLSVNNWDLRPMRKGLARIALKAWNSSSASTNLEVIPVGLTYEHYEGEGKVLLINIGSAIQKEQVAIFGNEASFVRNFNQLVVEGLAKLIPVLPSMMPGDAQHKAFRSIMQESATYNEGAASVIADIKCGKVAKEPFSETKWIKNTLLFYPLYLLGKWFAKKLFKQKLFHDSVIFGVLLLLWPIYLLLIWQLLRLIF